MPTAISSLSQFSISSAGSRPMRYEPNLGSTYPLRSRAWVSCVDGDSRRASDRNSLAHDASARSAPAGSIQRPRSMSTCISRRNRSASALRVNVSDPWRPSGSR
ncbi:MAG: hypothetical protein CYG61_00030 [Actinobacteria bacterium]|nr:MAG: hypothetical protein CYG61_00030 [Actinomycetota bacterium]